MVFELCATGEEKKKLSCNVPQYRCYRYDKNLYIPETFVRSLSRWPGAVFLSSASLSSRDTFSVRCNEIAGCGRQEDLRRTRRRGLGSSVFFFSMERDKLGNGGSGEDSFLFFFWKMFLPRSRSLSLYYIAALLCSLPR